MRKTSVFNSDVRLTRTWRPSGEISGPMRFSGSGSPQLPSGLPDRLYQVSCRLLATPTRYVTTPVAETENAPLEVLPSNATESATVSGLPLSSPCE
jgi:hypothetical protein